MLAKPLSARFTVDPTHPALAGHFPGDPIVPAVVLMRFVAQTLERGGRTLSAVERMKFLRPVRPGEVIDVTVTSSPGERGGVEIAIDGMLVASGAWRSIQS
jgi:3-hydroxyacyl-[acyl-carrier-protein] dehydratase